MRGFPGRELALDPSRSRFERLYARLLGAPAHRYLAHHAADERAEEISFRLAKPAAFDLLAEAMHLELGDDLVQVDSGHIHLVERLHRGKPRGAAGGVS